MKSYLPIARRIGIASAIIFPLFYFATYSGLFSSLVKSLFWGAIITVGYTLVSKKIANKDNTRSESRHDDSDLDNSIKQKMSDKSLDIDSRAAIAADVLVSALVSIDKSSHTSEQIIGLMCKIVEDGEEHPLIARLKNHPDFNAQGSLLNESIKVFGDVQNMLIETKKRSLALLLDTDADIGDRGGVAVNVVVGVLKSIGKVKDQSDEEKRKVRDMFISLPGVAREHPLIQLLKDHPDFNKPNTLLYGSMRVLEDTQKMLRATKHQEIYDATFAFNDVLVEMGREEDTDYGRIKTLALFGVHVEEDGSHPLIDLVKTHPSFNQEGSALNNAMKVFQKLQDERAKPVGG